MRTSTDSPPEIMTTGAGFAEFHGTSVFFAAMGPSLSRRTDTRGHNPAGIASPAVLRTVLPGAEPRFGVDGHRTAVVGAQHRNRSEGTQRLRTRMSVAVLADGHHPEIRGRRGEELRSEVGRSVVDRKS